MKAILCAAVLVGLSVSVFAMERMVGGWSDIPEEDTNDERFQEILAFAEDAVTEQSNSIRHLKVFKIIKATRQVVSGMNYDLELELAHTHGTKGDKSPSKELDHSLPHVMCKIRIWDQPWTKTRKITEFSCDEKKE